MAHKTSAFWLVVAITIGLCSGQGRLFQRNGQSQPVQFAPGGHPDQQQQQQPPPPQQLADRRSFVELPGGMFDEMMPQDEPARNEFPGGFMPGGPQNGPDFMPPQNGLEQGPPPQMVGRNAPPPPPQMREQELQNQQMMQDPFNGRQQLVPPQPMGGQQSHPNHIVNKQAQQIAIQQQIIQDQRQMLENQASQQNRQSRSSQSQPSGHVTVVHYPVPVVITPAMGGGGNGTGQQGVTVQVHHSSVHPSPTSGNSGRDSTHDEDQNEVRDERPRSIPNIRDHFRNPLPHPTMNRERRRLTGKDIGIHLIAKPRIHKGRPSSHSKSDAVEDETDPVAENPVVETNEDPTETEAEPPTGHGKRSCLTGDCGTVSTASEEVDEETPTPGRVPLCRGKNCVNQNFRSMTKHRRHLNDNPTDGNQLSSSEVQERRPSPSSMVTMVAERSISSGLSSSSNEVVCRLNNVPKADRCIEDYPWKEIIKQPINCGATKRQWRCYCGFFEE